MSGRAARIGQTAENFTTADMTFSCKDCTDREPGCHAKCEKYAADKDKIKKISDEKAKEREVMNMKKDFSASWEKRMRRKGCLKNSKLRKPK